MHAGVPKVPVYLFNLTHNFTVFRRETRYIQMYAVFPEFFVLIGINLCSTGFQIFDVSKLNHFVAAFCHILCNNNKPGTTQVGAPLKAGK